jgi:hypothetical protein
VFGVGVGVLVWGKAGLVVMVLGEWWLWCVELFVYLVEWGEWGMLSTKRLFFLSDLIVFRNKRLFSWYGYLFELQRAD